MAMRTCDNPCSMESALFASVDFERRNAPIQCFFSHPDLDLSFHSFLGTYYLRDDLPFVEYHSLVDTYISPRFIHCTRLFGQLCKDGSNFAKLVVICPRCCKSTVVHKSACTHRQLSRLQRERGWARWDVRRKRRGRSKTLKILAYCFVAREEPC